MNDYDWEIGSNVVGTIISGERQIHQWIQRVLSTERNLYPQYSSDYGIEFEHLKNRNFDSF